MFTGREKLILLFLAVAAVVGALAVYAQRGDPRPPAAMVEAEAMDEVAATATGVLPEQEDPAAEEEASTEAPEPEEPLATVLKVAVTGAVVSPGVYEFEGDARVQDLLDTAGGATEAGDLSDINLAAKLLDGSTLTVPESPAGGRERGGTIRRRQVVRVVNPAQYTLSGWRPEAPVGGGFAAAGDGKAKETSGLINLNTATAAELETLPGIGPKTAGKIIQYRTQNPFVTVDDLDNVSGIGEKRLEAVRGLVTVQ